MKFYIFYLLLLFATVEYIKSDLISNTDCSKIKPNKASDCVLSDQDKKNYIYCCYEKLAGFYYCEAYDKSGYDIQKEVYKAYPSMGMDYTFECNSSVSLFFKFTIVLFLIILF